MKNLKWILFFGNVFYSVQALYSGFNSNLSQKERCYRDINLSMFIRDTQFSDLSKKDRDDEYDKYLTVYKNKYGVQLVAETEAQLYQEKNNNDEE